MKENLNDEKLETLETLKSLIRLQKNHNDNIKLAVKLAAIDALIKQLEILIKKEDNCKYLLEVMNECPVEANVYRFLIDIPQFKDFIIKNRIAILLFEDKVLALNPVCSCNRKIIQKVLKKYGNSIKNATCFINGNGAYFFSQKHLIEERKKDDIFLFLPNTNIDRSILDIITYKIAKILSLPDYDKVTELEVSLVTKKSIEENFKYYKPILKSFFYEIDEKNKQQLNKNNKNLIKKQLVGESFGNLPLAKSLRYIINDLKTSIDNVNFSLPARDLGGAFSLFGFQSISDVEQELNSIDIGKDDKVGIGSVEVGSNGYNLLHTKRSFEQLRNFFENKRSNGWEKTKFTFKDPDSKTETETEQIYIPQPNGDSGLFEEELIENEELIEDDPLKSLITDYEKQECMNDPSMNSLLEINDMEKSEKNTGCGCWNSCCCFRS